MKQSTSDIAAIDRSAPKVRPAQPGAASGVLPGTSYLLMRRVFLSLLGAIFLVAFVSLWVQLDALLGSQGIWQVARFVETSRQHLGWLAPLRLPTLFQLSAADVTLHAVCAVGVLASLALIAGVAPRLCLAVLWASYLSFTAAGAVFLFYQWDDLLIETAFLAFFLAPPGTRRPRWGEPPPAIAIFLLRFLIFRLMFLAGLVKLVGPRNSWTDLTALDSHYWTQPLPTPLGWYAQHLPHRVLAAMTAGTLFVETVVPFLFFGPRRARQIAAAATALLQVLILLTGCFAFFNWLTIVLCVPALDDAAVARGLPAGLRARLVPPSGGAPAAARSRVGRMAGMALAAVYLVIASAGIAYRARPDRMLPEPVNTAVMISQPFRTINLYGLFEIMSTDRTELFIEGSLDAQRWRPYELRWKPGRVDEAPHFLAPHDPRVDFQIWFAAHGGCTESPWLLFLLQRLVEGSPPVVRLFRSNPFPERPPPFMRVLARRYRYTSLEEKRRTGAWWVAEPAQPYCPIMQVKAGLLVPAWDLPPAGGAPLPSADIH